MIEHVQYHLSKSHLNSIQQTPQPKIFAVCCVFFYTFIFSRKKLWNVKNGYCNMPPARSDQMESSHASSNPPRLFIMTSFNFQEKTTFSKLFPAAIVLWIFVDFFGLLNYRSCFCFSLSVFVGLSPPWLTMSIFKTIDQESRKSQIPEA